MAAMLSGNTALELTPVEAEMLGGALYDVAEEYGIVLTGPKAVWIKLAAAVGMVYGPRALSAVQAARSKTARRAASASTPGEVDGISRPFDFGQPQ